MRVSNVPFLKLTARGRISDIHWPQTRKHDVITFLIKSMGGHIKPSECVMCVVHLFKSPIFPVIICETLCKAIYSWSISGIYYNAEIGVQSTVVHRKIRSSKKPLTKTHTFICILAHFFYSSTNDTYVFSLNIRM